MTKPLADMNFDQLRAELISSKDQIANAIYARGYHESRAMKIEAEMDRRASADWMTPDLSVVEDGIPPEADNHRTGGETVDTATTEPQATGEGWDISKSTEAITPAETHEALTTDEPEAQSGDETTDIAARVEAALAGDGDEATGAALEQHRWPFGVRQEEVTG